MEIVEGRFVFFGEGDEGSAIVEVFGVVGFEVGVAEVAHFGAKYGVELVEENAIVVGLFAVGVDEFDDAGVLDAIEGVFEALVESEAFPKGEVLVDVVEHFVGGGDFHDAFEAFVLDVLEVDAALVTVAAEYDGFFGVLAEVEEVFLFFDGWVVFVEGAFGSAGHGGGVGEGLGLE